MAAAAKARRRTRGEVEALPSGSFRVRVYAGIDPLTRKRHYLTEVVPAGPKASKEAEKVRTRFLAEVDERRNPRTSATVNQLLERYLGVLEIEDTTRNGYERLIRLYIRPRLGDLPIGRIDGETLDAFTPSCAGVAHGAAASSGSTIGRMPSTTATTGADGTCASRSAAPTCDTHRAQRSLHARCPLALDWHKSGAAGRSATPAPGRPTTTVADAGSADRRRSVE